jgi:hypothetical protein
MSPTTFRAVRGSEPEPGNLGETPKVPTRFGGDVVNAPAFTTKCLMVRPSPLGPKEDTPKATPWTTPIPNP